MKHIINEPRNSVDLKLPLLYVCNFAVCCFQNSFNASTVEDVTGELYLVCLSVISFGVCQSY